MAFYKEADVVYSRRGMLPLQIEIQIKMIRLLIAFQGQSAMPQITTHVTRILEEWTKLKSEFDRMTIVIELSKVRHTSISKKRDSLL